MQGAIQSMRYKGEVVKDAVNIKDRHLVYVLFVAALLATVTLLSILG